MEHYGAVDISFVCDIPLFIDPMLIFNSEKEEYKKLHEEIIKYFHFLYQKACDGLSNKELKAWFEFNEVPNNWLGYSMSGNKGAALGKQYARFLYKNIRFATNTNNITKSNHIEKIATVYKGNIIKNLIMDCQSYTKYRPNETTGGIFVSWRRKEELPTGA